MTSMKLPITPASGGLPGTAGATAIPGPPAEAGARPAPAAAAALGARPAAVTPAAAGSAADRLTAGRRAGDPLAILHRAPARGIALIAGAAFAVEMTVSARYGYHRDELYFLEAGRHLSFGYVDQPALTPLLARLSAALFGNSLAGLRLIPALAMAGLVVLTAAMSRLAGAARIGQLLAALATATCAEYLAAMHLLTTTVPDFIFWSLTLLLVLRLLLSEDRRWWLAIGAAVGLGADAKWNIGFLVASLAVGFAVTPARRLATGRWLLAGALLAVVLAAPDVIWQAAHGWPNLAVFRALQGDAWHNRITYLPAQVLYTGVAIVPVWIGGLLWLLRSSQARRLRPVGIACAIVLGLFLVLGGKPYYPGAVFTVLLAAGSVPLERRLLAAAGREGERSPRWLSRLLGRVRHRAGRSAVASERTGGNRSGGSQEDGHQPRRSQRPRPGARTAAVMIACALVAVPVSLPVLPDTVLRTVPLQSVNYDLGETIAWPRLTGLVARAYDALPPGERGRVAILTGNYGEAGAIDRYGPALGLPPAYSGHNNFYLWGPPPAADTSVLAVNVSAAELRRVFSTVRRVATFSNGIGVSDDEQGAPIFLATGLRSSWAREWPVFRDYS